jgi:hypothetical protein
MLALVAALTSSGHRGIGSYSCNHAQPHHNRVVHASYACGSDPSEIPHGAGIQPNEINALAHTADFKTKTAAQSMRYWVDDKE